MTRKLTPPDQVKAFSTSMGISEFRGSAKDSQEPELVEKIIQKLELTIQLLRRKRPASPRPPAVK